MKSTFLALLVFLGLSLVLPAAAETEDGMLPFPVTVGGQAATYKAGDAFAKLGKPVRNNAEIEVTTKSDMTIINVAAVDKKGTQTGAAPAVILLQATNKGTLAGTMDKQKIAPGTYLMSVTTDSHTATIFFEIK